MRTKEELKNICMASPNDMKILSLCSEMACKHGRYCEIISVEEYHEHQTDDLSFHPNGKCGCIFSNDGNLFGIRCDHFMWAEGTCEGIEYFWTEEEDEFNAIFIYGNNKGHFYTKLLVLHKTQPK